MLITIKSLLLVCCLQIALINCNETEGELTNEEKEKLIKESQEKIKEKVLVILEHYKQEDPIGLPGAPVPDPMEIPPLSHSFSVGKMDFKNVKVYNLSKFRVDHVTADLAKMKVEAALRIENLDVYGNYTLGTWISRSAGPFTVKLTDVYVKAIANLEVERGGQLEAQEMNMDITFKTIAMNFEKLGLFASMFQSIMNSVGTFVFDSIKPFILAEANTNIRKDVNKQIHLIPQKFPNSVSPLDQLIAEARRKVRNMGYDPYKLDNYNHSVGIFDIYLTHTWLTGLSSFHRVGNMTLEIRNHTIHTDLVVGTQKLEGTSHWEVALAGGIISRAGTVIFTVNYFKTEIMVSQPLDTRNSPVLDDIQLELGNIQIRFDGAGTMDYIIELAVNVLPNLLRYQIMDAIEGPLKLRIQEALNNVNVEKIINENLSKLDEINELLSS